MYDKQQKSKTACLAGTKARAFRKIFTSDVMNAESIRYISLNQTHILLNPPRSLDNTRMFYFAC